MNNTALGHYVTTKQYVAWMYFDSKICLVYRMAKHAPMPWAEIGRN